MGELVDQEARRRAAEDLSVSLALEAAAGTGKTRTLVERVLSALRQGVPLEGIVLITFLEEAAVELRERLRMALRERPEPWARAALVALPTATIGTIHAFARQLLLEFPVEAGVDPAARTLSGVEEELALSEAYASWLQEALERDPWPVTRLRRAGFTLGRRELLEVARAGILAARVPQSPLPPSQRVEAFVQELEEAAALARSGRGACTDPRDAGYGAAQVLEDALAEVLSWEGEERLLACCRVPLRGAAGGNGANWRPKTTLQAQKQAVKGLTEAQKALRQETADALLGDLARWASSFHARWQEAKAGSGVLDFEDMLEKACRLLEGNEAVRERLRERIRLLLVDEFQDTDPVQFRIVQALAGDLDGRLFLVGDPKQSIYRFRGADVESYRRAVARLPEDLRLEIRVNFRSTPDLLEAANRICEPLFVERTAIPYVPLAPFRDRPPEGPPALWVLERPPGWDPGSAEESRAEEARAVAGLLGRALREQWPVGRRDRPEGVRPLTEGDVAVLVPTRSAYGAYLEAFRRFDIPCRTGRNPSAGRHPMVAEVRAVLCALDRPSSPLRVLAALRSRFFGLSDADLLRFHQSGGRFDLLDPRTREEDPVRTAIGRLQAELFLHDPLPQTLLRLLEGLDAAKVAALWDGADGVRGLAALVDAAFEAAAADPALSLRRFLALLDYEDRSGDGPLARSAGRPDGAAGAVRLMTIHEAKGLEFPLVVLGNLSAQPSRRTPILLGQRSAAGQVERSGMQLGNPAWGGPVRSSPMEEIRAADRQAEAEERIRLLYVALTRPRDYLLLPDFPPARRGGEDSLRDLLLAGSTAASLRIALEGSGLPCGLAAEIPEPPPAAAPDPAGLLAAVVRREEVLDTAGRRLASLRLLRPSGEEDMGLLAHGAAEGGGGVLFGRLFHEALSAVLQGEDPEAALGHLARREEAAADAHREVTALVRRTLQHPLLQRAMGASHRSVELPLAAPTAEGPVLGRIDLLFEDEGRLVLADFKTDACVSGGEETLAAERGYLRQMDLYGSALRSLLGREPDEAYLLFVRTGRLLPVPGPWSEAAADRSPAPA